MGLFIAVASSFAVTAGLNETRLSLSGPRKDFGTGLVPRGTQGWVSVFGCVRHDLAVVVTPGGEAFRLGSHSIDPDAGDRVFTPVTAHDDCDEDKPPQKTLALIEDDDALSNSLGRELQVAPPPVPAMIDGVIGFGAGHPKMSVRARLFFAQSGPIVGAVEPTIVKGRRPGLLWVGATTLAAGVHGYILILLLVWWVRRRIARARNAEAHDPDDPENQFFSSETI